MTRLPDTSSRGSSPGSRSEQAPPRADYWFKPHTYGYGATPGNWKGWLATAAFVAILVSASLLLFPWQPDVGTSPTIWQIAAWVFTVLVLTIGFIGLARAKTDGQWGWRWGKVGR